MSITEVIDAFEAAKARLDHINRELERLTRERAAAEQALTEAGSALFNALPPVGEAVVHGGFVYGRHADGLLRVRVRTPDAP